MPYLLDKYSWLYWHILQNFAWLFSTFIYTFEIALDAKNNHRHAFIYCFKKQRIIFYLKIALEHIAGCPHCGSTQFLFANRDGQLPEI